MLLILHSFGATLRCWQKCGEAQTVSERKQLVIGSTDKTIKLALIASISLNFHSLILPIIVVDKQRMADEWHAHMMNTKM